MSDIRKDRMWPRSESGSTSGCKILGKAIPPEKKEETQTFPWGVESSGLILATF
jgi:hypothetical protein